MEERQKLLSVINEVTSFPELHLGKPSLERLYAFIGGYLHHNEDADDHCMDGFNEYVAERTGVHTSHNWSSIIPFVSASEGEAFNTFIRLFKEFQKRKQEGNL